MTQTPEQERAVALEWLAKHCPIELKTANGGLVHGDTVLINDFIQASHGGLWSIQALNDAVEKLRPQLTWKSAAQMEYEKVYDALTADQQNIFGAWWFGPSTKRMLILDGDPGFENAAEILKWSRGKAFESHTFDLAVSNLVGNSRRGLHLVQESTFKPGRHSGEQVEWPKANRSAFEAHRDSVPRNDSAPTPKNTLSVDESRWQQMAEQLRGDNHSQDDQLARIHGASWRQTFELRQKFVRENSNRLIPTR